jgi:hypothetical protein
MYSSYSFMTLTLNRVSSRFTPQPPPGKGPPVPTVQRLGGPRAGLDTEAVGKILLPLPGTEPR